MAGQVGHEEVACRNCILRQPWATCLGGGRGQPINLSLRPRYWPPARAFSQAELNGKVVVRRWLGEVLPGRGAVSGAAEARDGIAAAGPWPEAKSRKNDNFRPVAAIGNWRSGVRACNWAAEATTSSPFGSMTGGRERSIGKTEHSTSRRLRREITLLI
jgi:hypothetical protein